MVLPSLIHPISITIELKDNSVMVFDGHEPMHGARSSASVTIEGQVSWGRYEEQNMEDAGIRPATDGYILLRKKDITDSGYDIDVGDKIIKIGWVECQHLFIVSKDPMGHYPDQNGPSLIKFHFADKSPTTGEATLD